MRVIVVDPLSPFGHKDINKVLLDNISFENEVVYIASSSFADFVPKHISFFPLKSSLFVIGTNSFLNRCRLFIALWQIWRIVRKIPYDVLIFMSYETLTFSLVGRLFVSFGSRRRVYLMNHLNIDELEHSRLKRLAFKLIPSAISHLVYEDFIKEYTVKTYKKKVITFHHNLNTYKQSYICRDFKYKDFFRFADSGILIVSPSGNSLSIQSLNEMIELDKEGFLTKNKIYVFIKSRQVHYYSSNLIIENIYLSDGEYSFVLSAAKFILLPYDLSYTYRASGVYFDALTFCKPVVYSEALFFRDQKDRFGEIGIAIKESMKATLECLLNDEYQVYKNNINMARHFYCDESFRMNLKKLIES